MVLRLPTHILLKALAFSFFFPGQFTFDAGKQMKVPTFIHSRLRQRRKSLLKNKFRDEKSSFFDQKTFIT